jgi:hypothetical protein
MAPCRLVHGFGRPCRRTELAVPGLPAPWSGVTVLHLRRARGLFATNNAASRWCAGQSLEPDLVFLTGDMLGDPHRSARRRTTARLRPALGCSPSRGTTNTAWARGPRQSARRSRPLGSAGVTLLQDACFALPDRGGPCWCSAALIPTGGFGLPDSAPPASAAGHDFPSFSFTVLRRPTRRLRRSPLAFAGHTTEAIARSRRSGLRAWWTNRASTNPCLSVGRAGWWSLEESEPASCPSVCSGRRRPGRWFERLPKREALRQPDNAGHGNPRGAGLGVMANAR